MHILTKDGKLIEGQKINAEEVRIYGELSGPEGLYTACREYIGQQSREQMAKYLIETFHMARRQPIAPVAPPEPEPLTPVSVFAPGEDDTPL